MQYRANGVQYTTHLAEMDVYVTEIAAGESVLLLVESDTDDPTFWTVSKQAPLHIAVAEIRLYYERKHGPDWNGLVLGFPTPNILVS